MDNTVIFVLGVGLSCFLMTCWSILDAAQKDFGSMEKKALWILIGAIPFMGFIIYLFFGYKRGKRPIKI